MKTGPFTVVVPGGETAEHLKSDDEFEFTSSIDGKRLGTGLIMFAWAGPLSAVPAALIEQHHDPAGRTYSGLVLLLRILYGHLVKNDSFVVSILQFKPTGGEIHLR